MVFLLVMATLLVSSESKAETVRTSVYWEGKKTANGEVFHKHGKTAAHRTLPFGTRLRVTNPKNGRSVTVRINDRGPFIAGRNLDLALGAAQALGFSTGVKTVQIERL